MESLVKQGFGFGAAWLLAVLVAGCATQPGMVVVGDVSSLPQTLLPGAKLAHARSLAMGMARSKGWDIIEAAPNRLLLERDLPRSSPQAVALGPSSVPPRIQVETNLVERGDGVVVALRSMIIANPGTTEERRIDYTSDYENELVISLSSLKSAWLANQQKIASEVPVPTPAVAAEQAAENTPETAGGIPAPRTDLAAFPKAPPAESASAPQPSSADVVVREPAPVPLPAPEPAAAPMSPEAPTLAAADTGAERLPAPSGDGLPASATPAIPAPAPATPAANDMLVLNTGARKGLWAYYAEDDARLRGCALADAGAVLLQETPTYELHEVHCAGSRNFLLRCQGGVCQEMR